LYVKKNVKLWLFCAKCSGLIGLQILGLLITDTGTYNLFINEKKQQFIYNHIALTSYGQGSQLPLLSKEGGLAPYFLGLIKVWITT